MGDGPKIFEGDVSGQNCRIAVAISRFNGLVGRPLLDGCLDALRRHGVAPSDVHVVWVPGAFELPLVAQRLAACGCYHAIVCLGAVIRGESPHFDYVCAQAASGILQAGLQANIPIIFGVLTTHNEQQAQARAGVKAGNKGFDAALCALEMAQLLRTLPPARGDQ